jgi:hypothetical protein
VDILNWALKQKPSSRHQNFLKASSSTIFLAHHLTLHFMPGFTSLPVFAGSFFFPFGFLRRLGLLSLDANPLRKLLIGQ